MKWDLPEHVPPEYGGPSRTYSVNCGPLGCIILVIAFIFMVQGCNAFFAGV